MREILFRGKLTANGKWSEGNLVVNKRGVYVITPDETPIGIYGQVDPETVGEYTGLTDKNGKKIFEGDILKFDYIGKNLGVNGISLCEFENGKFGVKWGYYKEFVCLDGFANTTLEVIGNIHDNPELLKGGVDNESNS